MGNKLIKEIITTTTERYGEEGSIKEKVTEKREKVYETNFSESEMDNAEVVETPAVKETPKEELVKQAAATIDASKSTPVQQSQPALPPQPQTYAPQYNVVGRQSSQPVQPQAPSFPWEQTTY